MEAKQIGIAHMSDNKIYSDKLRPGCIYSLDGTTLRAVKAEDGINPCKGCILDSFFACPNIQPMRRSFKRIQCIASGIIFKHK